MSSDEPAPDWLINSKTLRARHGGISTATLERRLLDPALRYPQPATRIGRIRYWRLSDVLAWERAQLRRPDSLTEPQAAPTSEPPEAEPAAAEPGEPRAAPAAAEPASRPASSRLVGKSRAARSRAPTADC